MNRPREPGAAEGTLNKSVRIFRYSTWQIIFQSFKLVIFLMTFLARLSSSDRKLGQFCSDAQEDRCLWSSCRRPEYYQRHSKDTLHEFRHFCRKLWQESQSNTMSPRRLIMIKTKRGLSQNISQTDRTSRYWHRGWRSGLTFFLSHSYYLYCWISNSTYRVLSIIICVSFRRLRL